MHLVIPYRLATFFSVHVTHVYIDNSDMDMLLAEVALEVPSGTYLPVVANFFD